MNTAVITPSAPRIPYAMLVAGWAALVVLSVFYCEAYRLAHGAEAIDLRYSAVWMVQIWSSWLIVGVGVAASRVHLAGRRLPIAGLLAVSAVLSASALSIEWLLNLVLADAGLIERIESFWALFNRRAFAAIVISAGLTAWALQPWRRLVDVPERTRRASAPPQVIEVMTRTGPLTVALSEIEAIIAAENYVQICTDDGKQHLLRIPLHRLEQQLDPADFKRVHRSSIVNMRHIEARLPGWKLRLSSGRIVQVARSHRGVMAP